MIDWLDNIHGFKVEKKEIPRPNKARYFANSSTLIGVLHTTEGSTVNGAWSSLNSNNVAPHFIIGEGRIVQCRPLTVQASALRSNSPHNPNVHAQIQIEMVGHSKQTLWLPDEGTLLPTMAILAYCNKVLGIPLTVPNDWPDDCSDLKRTVWAGNNTRRKAAAAGLWPKIKGWWMHLEIPHQQPSWHWDCGALRRSEMLGMAQKLITKDKI